MAKPKRVSVKGRGADIFFGGPAADQPPPPAAESPEAEVSPPTLPDTESDSSDQERIITSMQESKKARKQESAHARMQESKRANMPEVKSVESEVPGSPVGAEVLNAIWPVVSKRATVTNAFRYTDEELSWLADALYEVTKRYKVKLTKQDIVRLGLNAVLWDYRTRGEDSLLGAFVTKRKKQPGGE